MRKRFWVSMITCLFAIFSVFTLVAISKEECQKSICAGAWVKGGSKLRAKARVSSPSSARGQWGYRVMAGRHDERNSNSYTRGYSNSWTVSDYTANASAYAQNRGKYGMEKPTLSRLLSHLAVNLSVQHSC